MYSDNGVQVVSGKDFNLSVEQFGISKFKIKDNIFKSKELKDDKFTGEIKNLKDYIGMKNNISGNIVIEFNSNSIEKITLSYIENEYHNTVVYTVK